MGPRRDLGGYHVPHPTDWAFEVNVHDLQFGRRWRQGGWRGEKPKFETTIYGRAVTEGVDVHVFDKTARSNEFHFTLYSDAAAAELWKSSKSLDLLNRQTLDPEQSRIRNLQHAEFDKLPPTACLFYHGGWSLECRVPLPVLDELSADLEARLVEKLRVKIEWPFGFKENNTSSTTWCFFDGGDLKGYVASFDWLSATAPKVIQENYEENKTNEVSLAIKEAAASINKNVRKLIGVVAVIAGLIVIGLLFFK
jgi:hypothetical protein